MLQFLIAQFFRFAFWWKKRTGFIVFQRGLSITGTVLSLRSSKDGDALLNVVPDASCEWAIHPLMTRTEHVHCELVPWINGPERGTYATLQPGDRVLVTGDWGYDGVHLFDEKKWWLFPLEVLCALFRHQPNFRDGYFEIHPVTALEKI